MPRIRSGDGAVAPHPSRVGCDVVASACVAPLSWSRHQESHATRRVLTECKLACRWLDGLPPVIGKKLAGWSAENFYHSWEGLWLLCEEVRDEWALGIELHPVRGPPPPAQEGNGATDVGEKTKSRGKRDRKARTNAVGPIIRYELRDGENKTLPLLGAPWDPANRGPCVDVRLNQLAEGQVSRQPNQEEKVMDPEAAHAAFVEEQKKGTSQAALVDGVDQAKLAEVQKRAKEAATKRHNSYRLGHHKETAASKIQAMMRGRQARQQVAGYENDAQLGGTFTFKPVVTGPGDEGEGSGGNEPRPNAAAAPVGEASRGLALLARLEQQRNEVAATYAMANQALQEEKDKLAATEAAAGEARETIRTIEATLAGFNIGGAVEARPGLPPPGTPGQ